MKMRRLYILLALWSVLLMAPGLLAEAGVFGRLDINTNITGVIAGLWVGGYLAQFAIFLWIMNIVPKQKVLAWFFASLMPWIVDWTQPVSPWFLLLGSLATIAVAIWIGRAAQQDTELSQHGVRATGVVLEVLKPRLGINVVINGVYIKRRVRLRIEREDGVPAYEGLWNGTFMLGEIPSVGNRVPLRVDPAKPERFEYDDANSAADAPTKAAAASAPAVPRSSIADELERLARLRDRGALTEPEFDAAKKKLLSR